VKSARHRQGVSDRTRSKPKILRDLAAPALDSTAPVLPVAARELQHSPVFFRVFLSPLRCGSFLCSPAFPCDCKWVAFCLASHMLTRFDPFQHPPTIPHSRCIPPLSLSSGASSGDPCPHVHVQSATSAIHMKVKKTRYYHAYAASSRSPSPPTTHKRAGCVVHHQTKGSITRAPLTPVILPTPISI
jgi:hypothetical protein